MKPIHGEGENESRSVGGLGSVVPIGGGFVIRIVPKPGEEELLNWIHDPDWDCSIEKRKGQDSYNGVNVSLECSEMLRSQYGSDHMSSSWLLARLWHLTRGRILDALVNVDETGEGFGDGGGYEGFLLVEKGNQALAVLGFSGTADTPNIMLDIRQHSASLTEDQLEQIYRTIARWLIHEPVEIATCKITVQDPELNSFPWEYGWDGTGFLRWSQEAVLAWYGREGREELGKRVEEALQQLESHPLHHLERRERETVCRSFSLYIRTFRTFAISRGVFRMRMELAVMSRAADIWRSTWKKESRLPAILAKCRALIYAQSSGEREKIMSGSEEDWAFVKGWLENTSIRDKNHTTHRFSASLAGLCVMQGMVHMGWELERYQKAAEKWKLLRNDHPNYTPEDTQHIHDEMAKFVSEQDLAEMEEDSWGETAESDVPGDFYREDMHFYAACAYAGGVPYRMEGWEVGDPQRFREFWRWWLLEAIPTSL